MSIPVIEGYQATDSGGNEVTTLELVAPSGITAGELLLIICGADSNADSGVWPDNITGWIWLGTVGTATSDVHLGAYYKIADGEEGNVTVDPSPYGYETFGFYIRISGVDTEDPIEAVSMEASQTSNPHDINPVTTEEDNCLIIAGLAWDGADAGSFAISGTGWAEVAEVFSGSDSNDCCGVFAQREQATAGVGTVCYVTAADQSDGAAYCQIAINGAMSEGAVYTLALIESLDVVDVLSLNIIKRIDLVLSDSLDFIDVQSTAREIYFRLSEIADLSEVISQEIIRLVILDLVESINIHDDISSEIIRILELTLAEGIDVVDAVNISRALFLALADSIDSSDSLKISKEVFIRLAEGLDTVDFLSFDLTRIFVLSLAETLSMEDLVSITLDLFEGWLLSLSESIGVEDSVQVSTERLISLSEVLNIEDLVDIFLPGASVYPILTLSEELTLADTIEVTRERVLNFVESLDFVDLPVISRVISLAIAEAFDLSEASNITAQRILTLAEDLTTNDIINLSTTLTPAYYTLSLSEAFDIVDESNISIAILMRVLEHIETGIQEQFKVKTEIYDNPSTTTIYDGLRRKIN